MSTYRITALESVEGKEYKRPFRMQLNAESDESLKETLKEEYPDIQLLFITRMPLKDKQKKIHPNK